jgi:hypothetical protein
VRTAFGSAATWTSTVRFETLAASGGRTDCRSPEAVQPSGEAPQSTRLLPRGIALPPSGTWRVSATLRTGQQAVGDFPPDERHKKPGVLRTLQQLDQPYHRVEQQRIERAHGKRARRRARLLSRSEQGDHLAYFQRVHNELERQVRRLWRGGDDTCRRRNVRGNEQVPGGVVAILAVTEHDSLAALGNHAQRGFIEDVGGRRRLRVPVQRQPAYGRRVVSIDSCLPFE